MLQRIASLLRIRPPLIENRGLLFGSGTIVPEDGSDGWQTSAVFQKTSGNSAAVLYTNIGSVDSSVFRVILTYSPE